MSQQVSYKDLDDNYLIRLFKEDRDQRAFAELMDRHQVKLYSYLVSMVKNREVANDLFQDTFTKVLEKMDRLYDEQGKFVAWLMRIAHNAAIDYLRKRKRVVDIPQVDDDGEPTDFYARIEDDAQDSQAHAELDEATKRLMKYVQELPIEQREVVTLRHYYEMSFKEIADLTGVSINTALGRMRYALINLRKSFEKENGKSYKFV